MNLFKVKIILLKLKLLPNSIKKLIYKKKSFTKILIKTLPN